MDLKMCVFFSGLNIMLHVHFIMGSPCTSASIGWSQCDLNCLAFAKKTPSQMESALCLIKGLFLQKIQSLRYNLFKVMFTRATTQKGKMLSLLVVKHFFAAFAQEIFMYLLLRLSCCIVVLLLQLYTQTGNNF